MTLALSACASGPTVLLDLDATTVELLRGGSVQVMVTLTRLTEQGADVTLGVTGLPANVFGSFAPATLSGGVVSSTLTLRSEAAALEGSHELAVTGTASGTSVQTPLTLEVVGLTVTGRLVASSDVPVAGASVASQGATDVSDANGAFSLAGLAVPYTLNVWSTADRWAHVYEGLTTDDLLLASPVAENPLVNVNTTTITGTLSGGDIPVGADQEVNVCVVGADTLVYGCDVVGPAESTYSLAVEWVGAPDHQVELHALQVTKDGSDFPLDYPGYASAELALSHGVPVVADLDLGSALPAQLVQVDVDTSTTTQAVIAAVQLTPTSSLRVAVIDKTGTSYPVLMPIIDGASYTFIGYVSLAHFGWLAGVTGGNALVHVPDVLTLVAPTEAATGVTTETSFAVAPASAAPFTYFWDHLSAGRFALTTMATEHVMPDPTLFGLTLPANAAGYWSATSHASASVEGGTSFIQEVERVALMTAFGASPGVTGAGGLASTATRTFTTAP
jgi:hypothetical protein